MTPYVANLPKGDGWERFIRDRRRALLQAWLGSVAYPGLVVLLAFAGTTIVVKTTGIPLPINPRSTVRAVVAATTPVIAGLLLWRRRRPSPFLMYDGVHRLIIALARGESFPGALRSAARAVESRRMRSTLIEAARRCDAGIEPTVAFTGARLPQELRRCFANARNREDLVQRLDPEIERFDQRERLRIARLAAILRPTGILLGGAVLLFLVARVFLPALETFTTIPMEGL